MATSWLQMSHALSPRGPSPARRARRASLTPFFAALRRDLSEA
eukprot:CAMPEP_0173220574 /NCGR_PEP_ID=MMETSP1142-20121109/2237_1 /TAXON_ID=483371 /ORGANISM="non described non described, Strain CCMP2298" /LENGTH=42 /DNA_ID= /DNA_START= /DNA_END= /DNA_ORIENTATION=